VTTLYLVRHAESTGGPGDACLAPSGVEQAHAVGQRLAARPIDHVFSSPLCRALETARIVAARVGAPDVVVDDRLTERANWGEVPGQAWDEFVVHWERGNAERDFVVPGGRSSRAAGAQFAACVDDVHRQWPDGEVVLVSHGGVIVDYLLHHFDEPKLLRRRPDLRHMRWCAVTELRYENEGVALGCLADWPDGGS
jgi:broad specificity phosphatase PhoE